MTTKIVSCHADYIPKTRMPTAKSRLVPSNKMLAYLMSVAWRLTIANCHDSRHCLCYDLMHYGFWLICSSIICFRQVCFAVFHLIEKYYWNVESDWIDVEEHFSYVMYRTCRVSSLKCHVFIQSACKQLQGNRSDCTVVERSVCHQKYDNQWPLPCW